MWHTINNNNCGRFTYLVEPEVASSQTFCLDTYLSELAKSRTIQEQSCSNDSEMGCSQSSQSGTTSAPLTGDLGVAQLTFFAEDFLVKTSARLEKEQELLESVLDYGKSICESFKRLSLEWSLPKTHRFLEVGGLSPSCKTLPKMGMMQDGLCLEVVILKHRIPAKECGFSLPTPTATDGKGGGLRTGKYAHHQVDSLRNWLHLHSGVDYRSSVPLPWFAEAAMSWPISWTDLKPLGTDKIQEWLDLHGRY